MLEIAAGGFSFTARLEEADAPESVAASAGAAAVSLLRSTATAMATNAAAPTTAIHQWVCPWWRRL